LHHPQFARSLSTSGLNSNYIFATTIDNNRNMCNVL
jgi:hypothetical protein